MRKPSNMSEDHPKSPRKRKRSPLPQNDSEKNDPKKSRSAPTSADATHRNQTDAAVAQPSEPESKEPKRGRKRGPSPQNDSKTNHPKKPRTANARTAKRQQPASPRCATAPPTLRPASLPAWVPDDVYSSAQDLVKKCFPEVSLSVDDTRLQLGPLVGVALPLKPGGNYDPNLSSVVHGAAWETLIRHCDRTKLASDHKEAIAVVQVSGGGKSKLALDLCIKGGQWPVYVPMFTAAESAKKMPALEALKAKIREQFDLQEDYKTAKKLDDALLGDIRQFLWAHVVLARAVKEALIALPNLRDEHRRVLYVEIFKGKAAEVSTVVAQSLDFECKPLWAQASAPDLSVVYDEVAQVMGEFKGWFLHQEQTQEHYDKTKFRVLGNHLLQVQRAELVNEALPDQLQRIYSSPTDLLYAFRRCQNELLGYGIPQILLDTTFSISRRVFLNQGSATRQLIQRVSPLSPVNVDSMMQWFVTVFPTVTHELTNDEELKAKLQEFRGRPRGFYDNLVAMALMGQLRKKKPETYQELRTCILDALPIAKLTTVQWMRNTVANKVKPDRFVDNQAVHALIQRSFIGAWRNGGEITLHPKELRQLVSDGLVFSEGKDTSAEDEQEDESCRDSCNLRREPLMWEALEEYFVRHAMSLAEFLLRSATNTADSSHVGKELEYAFAWRVYAMRGQLLTKVIPTIPDCSAATPWLAKAIIRVESVHNEPDQNTFKNLLLQEDYAMIFPHQDCGPDLVFSVQVPGESKEPVPVRVYVQIKSTAHFSVPKALATICPLLFWCTDRKTLAKQMVAASASTSSGSQPKPVLTIHEAFKASADLRTRNIRMMVSGGGFTPGFTRWAQQPAPADFPVLCCDAGEFMRCDAYSDFMEHIGFTRASKPQQHNLWYFVNPGDVPPQQPKQPKREQPKPKREQPKPKRGQPKQVKGQGNLKGWLKKKKQPK